ncbi:transcriptional regulator [Actinoalloteichus sp. GBA129-24]|uniref:transcriptional regulator n=1 Tax=Actinoalloteichus sp. GBA129-24 TaxID=1612551 RepID=UPI0009503B23|nr:transcriptional regulator [Actinoalloteichus sp. GBA129-24]APU18597.1 hypothetical protein UA75_02790 [Actinoalloteichus sp. GBA129-24]
MHDDVRALLALPTPMDRAQRAGQLHADYQARTVEVSRIRKEALAELIGQGLSQTQIGEALDMSRSRVQQLLSSGPRVERAFLGTGPLTVALGGKLEAKDSNPGPVLAQEDFHAYEMLQSLAKSLSLETSYEVVQPPGFLDLNRDNLVVICGPRLSPMIAQVLASDDHLAFGKDEAGWFLSDKKADIDYRSPMDEGESSDYAYFGRLPRPDGKGTFLYIAGIHAVGATGVVHYLENHLAELYRELKTDRFSTLIKCVFNPESRKIKSSGRVPGDYYRPGVS